MDLSHESWKKRHWTGLNPRNQKRGHGSPDWFFTALDLHNVCVSKKKIQLQPTAQWFIFSLCLSLSYPLPLSEPLSLWVWNSYAPPPNRRYHHSFHPVNKMQLWKLPVPLLVRCGHCSWRCCLCPWCWSQLHWVRPGGLLLRCRAMDPVTEKLFVTHLD